MVINTHNGNKRVIQGYKEIPISRVSADNIVNKTI